jgi:SAM-dependent methyltransferase
MVVNSNLPSPPAANKPDQIKKWIRINFLSSYLKNIDKRKITLDLGCGWGFSFEINSNFYGVELDANCVNFCVEKGYKVKQGNILDPLPYPENFFDVCFCHDVLEHFPLSDVDRIFQNVHKILKNGGEFLLITPHLKGFNFGVEINNGHIHYIIPGEIKTIAENNGYKYLSHSSVPFPKFINEFFTHGKYLTRTVKEGLIPSESNK